MTLQRYLKNRKGEEYLLFSFDSDGDIEWIEIYSHDLDEWSRIDLGWECSTLNIVLRLCQEYMDENLEADFTEANNERWGA